MIKKKFFATIYILLQSIVAVCAQQAAEFDVPFNFPLYLSGNFAELRSNHFHAGLDFKTQGVEGKPISVIAYGITGGDTMVQVAINKEHSGFGRLLGPATERYDISSTVLETIDGEEKGTVSADDCYYNLLAVKGMDGKTAEDISTMDLSLGPRYYLCTDAAGCPSLED